MSVAATSTRSTRETLLVSAFFLFIPAAVLTAGGGAVNRYSKPAKLHRTKPAFKNHYVNTINKKFGELLRWQLKRSRQGSPWHAAHFGVTPMPDLARIKSLILSTFGPAAALQVSRIGHVCRLVGPMISRRARTLNLDGPGRSAHESTDGLLDHPPKNLHAATCSPGLAAGNFTATAIGQTLALPARQQS